MKFSINLLKKYAGHTGLNTPLHNLGTDHWMKIKNRAKKKVNDIAVELLEVQSKRLSCEGYQFKNNIWFLFLKKILVVKHQHLPTN
jgi:transcription-repair coupling factor (superfamily II helicase)